MAEEEIKDKKVKCSPQTDRRNKEMDIVYEKYKRERRGERELLKQRREVADTVPFRISDAVQVWLPTELLVVVRALWEPVLESLPASAIASEVVVWSEFMNTVYHANVELIQLQGQVITPATRKILLRLALDRFEDAVDRAFGVSSSLNNVASNNVASNSVASTSSIDSITIKDVPSYFTEVHSATAGQPKQLKILKVYFEVIQ